MVQGQALRSLLFPVGYCLIQLVTNAYIFGVELIPVIGLFKGPGINTTTKMFKLRRYNMVLSQQIRVLSLPVLSCLLLSFALWALVLPAGLVFSKESPFEPGFEGSLQPGVAVVSSKSLDHVGDDNRRINSLDQDPGSDTEIAPILLWEMTYTLENGRTQFFAGTPQDNMADGAFLMEAGVRHALPDETILFRSGPAGHFPAGG